MIAGLLLIINESCQCEMSDAHEFRYRSLLRLEATCPNCSASFRDHGVEMRRLCDDWATFHDAIVIIMEIEEMYGIEIPDSVIEAQGTWEKMTIHQLVSAIHTCMSEETMICH